MTPEEKIEQEAEKRCYPRELDAFISGAKSNSGREYHLNNIPYDEIKNIVGYIDTPIGRRKYPVEVIESVQALKEWLNEN